MFVRLSFILYTIAKMTRFVEFADGTCKNYRFASNPASGKVVWNNSTLCSHYRDGWRTKERVSHVRKQQQHHTYTPRHTHSPSNKHVIQQPATKYFFFFFHMEKTLGIILYMEKKRLFIKAGTYNISDD